MPNRATSAPQPDSSLAQRQNTADLLDLLRAALATHATTRRLAGIRIFLALVVAASALLATFVPGAGEPVAIIGALWAVAYSVGVSVWARGFTVRAAVLHEMFDVRLYGMPWNAVLAGDPIDWHEVKQIAKQYRGSDDDVRDYYEIAALPRPYDVAACQIQNLAWGSRVRRRYRQVVVAGVTVWSIGGVLVGLLAGLTVAQLVLWWFVPSLGALLLGVDTYRVQVEVEQERRRALQVLQGRLRNPPTGRQAMAELETLSRQVQDIIFATRKQHARVPAWFFERFREADRADFKAAIRDLETTLASAIPRYTR